MLFFPFLLSASSHPLVTTIYLSLALLITYSPSFIAWIVLLLFLYSSEFPLILLVDSRLVFRLDRKPHLRVYIPTMDNSGEASFWRWLSPSLTTSRIPLNASPTLNCPQYNPYTLIPLLDLVLSETYSDDLGVSSPSRQATSTRDRWMTDSSGMDRQIGIWD